MSSTDPCFRRDANNNWQRILVDFRCRAKEPDGHSMCCSGGDFCLSNGICRYGHNVTGTSGFYAASCTDQTLLSDACVGTRRCRLEILSDIVYVNATDSWRCCGSNALGGGKYESHCSNPTGATFDAPSPEVLDPEQSSTTRPTVSTSSSVSTPSDSRGTSTETIPAGVPTNSTTDQPPSGLSTGAVAGIGVGSALAGALVIGLLIWIILRRRNALKQNQEARPADVMNVGMAGMEPELQRRRTERHELRTEPRDLRGNPSDARRTERHELKGDPSHV